VLNSLTRVLANLASNKENRIIIGEGGSISHMLHVLDHPNEEVKENILRAIMNLSVAPENEDRIRLEGGLTALLEILQDPQTPPKILLQAVRVLVNLACNDINKTIMLRAGALDRVTALLLTPETEKALCHRLVRLLGTFSVGSDLSDYQQITEKSLGQFLIRALKENVEQNAQDNAESKTYSEVILMAISKITTAERPAQYRDALIRFQNFFIEEDENDGSCGIDWIYPYLRLTANGDEPLISSSISVLQNLSRGNDKVQVKIRGSGALNALKELYSLAPPIGDKAADLVKSLSVIPATTAGQ